MKKICRSNIIDDRIQFYKEEDSKIRERELNKYIEMAKNVRLYSVIIPIINIIFILFVRISGYLYIMLYNFQLLFCFVMMFSIYAYMKSNIEIEISKYILNIYSL